MLTWNFKIMTHMLRMTKTRQLLEELEPLIDRLTSVSYMTSNIVSKYEKRAVTAVGNKKLN